MRKFVLTLAFTMLATASITSAAFGQTVPGPVEPQKVPAAYTHAYIPAGFDSNDDVEVVLEGMFSSSCWRPADIQVAVDHDQRKVFVGPAAYMYPQRLCAQMIMPFDRVVSLGMLKAGVYELVQATDGAVLGKIPVSAAVTDAPDDFTYAPISQAFFKAGTGSGELMIVGNFPNNCMSLDEVRVGVQKDVVVVQPIAKVEKRRDCKDGSFPFNSSTIVNFIPNGRYLMHVRSANAKSINTLIDVL